MPSNYPTIILPILLGLNLRDDITRLNAGECAIATNVIINTDGSVERVDGYTNKLSSSLGTSMASSLFGVEKDSGSYEVYFKYETDLYQLDIVNWTHRKIYDSFFSDSILGYAFYNDYIYVGDGIAENKVIIPTPIHWLNRAEITTADATDLTSAISLANEIKSDYNIHIASTSQHNVADTSNSVTSSNATDLTSAIILVNEIKSDFNNHRIATGIHDTVDSYHQIEAANASDLSTLITLINEIKLLYNQHINCCKVMKWGIKAPTGAATASAVSGSGLGIGTYKYVYTYYNIVDGVESPPSPLVSVTTTSGNQKVSLSNIGKSTDPQVTHKRIYRTVVGGSTYYRVADITNRTTTYTDTTPDASLGTTLKTENFAEIPKTSIFTIHNERIYMSGNLENPNKVYYTEPFYPHFYNEAYNYFDFNGTIKALATIDNGLFIFEKYKHWKYAGLSPTNMTPIVMSEYEGCTNPYGVTYINKNPVWVSNTGIKYWDGEKIIPLSLLIDKELLTHNLDSCNLVYNHYKNILYVFFAEI